MESGSGGEREDDSELARDSEQARANLRVEATGAASLADPLPKDYLISDAIGKALQAHYRSLADAPLPDRFLILLAELEAKDTRDAG